METDKATIPKSSDQGTALETDVLSTRVRPCAGTFELQREKWDINAAFDLIDHCKKREVLINPEALRWASVAAYGCLTCHEITASTARLLLLNLRSWMDEPPVNCNPAEADLRGTQEGRAKLARTNADGLAGFAVTVIRASDQKRSYIEHCLSWSAAKKTCEAMAYCHDSSYVVIQATSWLIGMSGVLAARERVHANIRNRILSNCVWPDEHAVVKVTRQVNTTFPFDVKNWVVEEYAEQALRNPCSLQQRNNALFLWQLKKQPAPT